MTTTVPIPTESDLSRLLRAYWSARGPSRRHRLREYVAAQTVYAANAVSRSRWGSA